MGNSYLEMENISKSFSGTRVLKNVSLEVREGEALALMGANGAGKSTLMNILGGVVEPDEGSIYIEGSPVRINNAAAAEKYGIGFIHQELALCHTMSAAENVFLNKLPMKGGFVNTAYIEEETRKVLGNFGCGLDAGRRVKDLSAGDRQLVEIARALISNAKILIFDEPTSSLAAAEKERFFEIIESLKKDNRVIIYITHFLDEIFNFCDSVQVLRNGETAGQGKIDEFDHHKIVNLMVGDFELSEELKREFKGREQMMNVVDLCRDDVLNNISFDLKKGEVLGLWGLMGSGRTEVVRAITGLDRIDSGRIEIKVDGELTQVNPKKVRKWIGLITENRRDDGLFLSLPVRENISSANLRTMLKKDNFSVDAEKERKKAEEQVDLLDIKVTGIEQPAGTLSGGKPAEGCSWALADQETSDTAYG